MNSDLQGAAQRQHGKQGRGTRESNFPDDDDGFGFASRIGAGSGSQSQVGATASAAACLLTATCQTAEGKARVENSAG
jgi:hypothetical protein